MSAICIKNLSYWYPESKVPALDTINLEFEMGEFVLIIGGSGSGKSTLLRAIKGLVPRFHGGRITGEILIKDVHLEQLSSYERTTQMGFVFQNPEDQVVMTKVEDEISFGMENVGIEPIVMKRRMMEVADALGINPLLNRSVNELSGGQLQKTALASVLTMQPEILLMDEPTSQLDPFSGEDTLGLAKRLNEDNGITVLLVEQRLERCIHLADRVVYMVEGCVVLNTTDIQLALKFMADLEQSCVHPLGHVFSQVGIAEIPLTVKSAQLAIRQMPFKQAVSAKDVYGGGDSTSQQGDQEESNGCFKPGYLLKAADLHHAYEGIGTVLKDVHFELRPASFTTLLGENGAGKSTLLKILAGILKADRGSVFLDQQNHQQMSLELIALQVGYLSQNPNDYLLADTVKSEILFTLKQQGRQFDEETKALVETLGLTTKLDAHPRDLSSGERQRVALASILSLKPKLLLLDEPTRGLDYFSKQKLGVYLQQLCNKGIAVFMVTHDVEFASEYSDQVMLMSRGEIVARGGKREVITDSIFYTSQIRKAFKPFAENVVTVEDAVGWLKAIV